MAADEALLDAAAEGTASLRFYRWAEPTLSLGYFQAEAACRADPALARLPFVRRPTGGEALVHHHELTYALALPAGAPWQRRGTSWLCRMHGVIAAAIAGLGVAVRAVCEGEERRLGDVLCFLHQTPGDLLLGEAKVAGSAQRKRRGALLQHGAVLLARSPFTPALPGLHELAGFPADGADRLAAAVGAAFARETGWDLEPARWSDAERRHVDQLARTRYSQPGWNSRR
jgi:lipoate-protein ligase A